MTTADADWVSCYGPPGVTQCPLSVLIDRAAGAGPRDEAFVRAFAAWLTTRGALLELPVVERLGLTDVVVTFVMKRRVRLLITGAAPDHPGEVTLAIDEGDFPFTPVIERDTVRSAPYTFCTLDHSLAGRPVNTPRGPGRLVVSATIDGRVEHRVLVGDHTLTMPAADVELA